MDEGSMVWSFVFCKNMNSANKLFNSGYTEKYFEYIPFHKGVSLVFHTHNAVKYLQWISIINFLQVCVSHFSVLTASQVLSRLIRFNSRRLQTSAFDNRGFAGNKSKTIISYTCTLNQYSAQNRLLVQPEKLRKEVSRQVIAAL